jgi:zinc protease
MVPQPPPGGGNPQGAFGGSGGGRGQRPPAPPVGDVIDKYLAAVGGRAAVEKLQSLSLAGMVTNRAGQASAFIIEEKQNRYREVRQTRPDANVRGFDGTGGWEQVGAKTVDLGGFALDQALRLNDVGGALRLTEKYPTLQAGGGRPMQINGKDTTVLTGRAGIVTDQYYFDSASGLLLRRVVSTRTPLGQLQEQIDYADYRAVGAVKVPYEIKVTNWNTLDTFSISEARANVGIDDGRFGRPR